MAHERVAVLRPAVMHPFSAALRVHEAGPLQAREMSGNLRLDYAKRIGQFAHARFAVGEEIQQAQPCWIGQCFKKERGLAISSCFHFQQ